MGNLFACDNRSDGVSPRESEGAFEKRKPTYFELSRCAFSLAFPPSGIQAPPSCEAGQRSSSELVGFAALRTVGTVGLWYGLYICGILDLGNAAYAVLRVARTHGLVQGPRLTVIFLTFSVLAQRG